MNPATNITQVIDQPALDGRMPILETFIQDKLPGGKGLRQFIEACAHRAGLLRGQNANTRQAGCMGLARSNIEWQQLAVENNVLPGQKAHYPLVDGFR